MPREVITIENILKETAYLAPEQFKDRDFMDAWCQKYFGCKFDDPLIREPQEHGTTTLY